MGQVWRAIDERLGRAVAVKVLNPGSASDVDAERFRLEAMAAGRISDPHVVAVYDFGEEDDRLFLVTELVDGCSLADELHRCGALPPDRAASLIAQAALGLAAAHDHGVVHRDIKPANLLLTTHSTETGTEAGTDAGTEAAWAVDTYGLDPSSGVGAGCLVKVADFGIARVADEVGAALTATGQIAGTSQYLAPERAIGGPGGPASDVYSLGCVGYQLVTGAPPFRGDVPAAIAFQHVHTAPVSPRDLCPQISGELEDLLLRMLAKDPAQRPSARQVAQWAITAVTGEATQPFDVTRDSSRARSRSARRAASAAAGVAVALTALTVAMAWATLHPHTDAGPPPPHAPTSVRPPQQNPNSQPAIPSTQHTATAGRSTGAPATGPTGRRSSEPSTSAGRSGEPTPAASPNTSTTPPPPSPSSPPPDPTTTVPSATDQTTPAETTSVPTASPTKTQPTTPMPPPR